MTCSVCKNYQDTKHLSSKIISKKYTPIICGLRYYAITCLGQKMIVQLTGCKRPMKERPFLAWPSLACQIRRIPRVFARRMINTWFVFDCLNAAAHVQQTFLHRAEVNHVIARKLILDLDIAKLELCNCKNSTLKFKRGVSLQFLFLFSCNLVACEINI